MRDTLATIRRLTSIALAASCTPDRGRVPLLRAERQRRNGDDSPSWSPTGNEIAYTSFQRSTGGHLRHAPDGSDKRRLTTDPAYDDIPMFSPDGKRIAFVSSRSGSLQIWVMNADGSDQHESRRASGRTTSRLGRPTARGSRFAPTATAIPRSTRCVPTAPTLKRLTNDGSIDLLAELGPDGTDRLRQQPDDGAASPSLWVMNADGSDQHRLTPRDFVWNELSPVWSADGKRLLCSRPDRDVPVGNRELYVMNADLTGLKRLTRYPGQDNWPTWSPDGSRSLRARPDALPKRDLRHERRRHAPARAHVADAGRRPVRHDSRRTDRGQTRDRRLPRRRERAGADIVLPRVDVPVGSAAARCGSRSGASRRGRAARPASGVSR
jgi:Tol biopolymer transport system component